MLSKEKENQQKASMKKCCKIRCCCFKKAEEGNDEESSNSESFYPNLERMTTTQAMQQKLKEKQPTLLKMIKSLDEEESESKAKKEMNSTEKLQEMLIHSAVNRGPPTAEITNDYYVVELVKNPKALQQVLKKSNAWRHWAMKQKCGSLDVYDEVKRIIGLIARLKLDDLHILNQSELIIGDIALDIRDYIEERIVDNDVKVELDMDES